MSDAKHLAEILDVRQLVDEEIERALLAHMNLAEVMSSLLPAVSEKVGAKGAYVQSYGEDLKLGLFLSAPSLVIPRRDEVLVTTGPEKREPLVVQEGADVLVAQPLDVAGEWFGSAGFVFAPGTRFAKDPNSAKPLLAMLCEELDNYLFSIRSAREKHNLMMQLARALRHRVLGEGLRQAVGVLAQAIPLDRMLLVYTAEENATSTLHVQIYEQGGLKVDTMTASAQERAEIMREARDYMNDRGAALLERFGFVGAQEEVLINGVTKSVIVGKVVASSKGGPFSTYSRDLLGGFAGYIRQRVVDFNKEWRRLAASFSPDDVARLLQSDDYEQRFLVPREAEVAMLYCDIAGFTRISEQVLKTPSAVANLVEAWSKDAVELVWKHGGVFDKMVGDCIIALFGPPFYDDEPGERLARAIRCAKDIREMTLKLPERPALAILREGGIGVSTGVNMAPLFVGTFGPNGNFTGFSSGMNNTARLQGCAKKDQILVMEEALGKLPSGGEFAFGDEESAAVKNVAHPLRFRALKG